MAISITFGTTALTAFQTFYTAHRVDLIESLAYLINDEKSMGISEESGNLIVALAHFYFDHIETIRQSFDAGWTYLDWLTQAEYDEIIYKREVLGY